MCKDRTKKLWKRIDFKFPLVRYLTDIMPGDSCIVCGNTRKKDPSVSYHRFPSKKDARSSWLEAFDLSKDDIKPHHRVCSRHFSGGDPSNGPRPGIGKRFASPIKKGAPRSKRAKVRQEIKDYEAARSSSRSVTPLPSSQTQPHMSPSPQLSLDSPLTALVGEQFESDYQVHELPDETMRSFPGPSNKPSAVSSGKEDCVINAALLARIEVLEADNSRMKKSLSERRRGTFGMEDIKQDDKLVLFYTGFNSYKVFLAFYEFLGPAVEKLNYWGSKQNPRKRNRSTKLRPMDQLLMTLMKLRLNLKLLDLAVRFGVSESTVSRYVTTWICFLYHHLKEVDWMPSVDQVTGTLPSAFREKYASTYAIIDGSEVFLETPSDLHMQSSTWSNYKHHNTAKFLIACTPNGCISFISPLYVGSISDIELTKISGFITHLKDKPGISIMADRGFTIKDLLKDVGVELNIPPFMEGRTQLPAGEVQEGRQIASLRIHVERAIGRIKTYSILKHTLPISLARLSNQIVCVCAYLSNFKPVLVPPESLSLTDIELDVEEYFECLSESEEEQ